MCVFLYTPDLAVLSWVNYWACGSDGEELMGDGRERWLRFTLIMGVPWSTALWTHTAPSASENGFGLVHRPRLSQNAPSVQHGTEGEVWWGLLSVCLLLRNATDGSGKTQTDSTPLPYLSDKLPLPVGEACVPGQNAMSPGTETRQCHNTRSDYISAIRFTVPRNRETISCFILSGCRGLEGGGWGLREGNAGSVQLVNNLD